MESTIDPPLETEQDQTLPGPDEAVSLNPPRSLGRWKRCALPAKLIISATLLFWILSRTSLGEVADAMTTARPEFLMLSVLTPVLGFFIGACRWSSLLRVFDVAAPIRRLMISYAVAGFFNNFLPSTIGGDGMRAYDSWRLGASKAIAVAIVVVERMLGLAALFLIAGGAMLFSSRVTNRMMALPNWFTWLVGIGTIGSVAVFTALAWYRPLIGVLSHSRLARVQGALRRFQDQKSCLLKGLALSLVLQCNVILQHYLMAKALMLPMSLLDCFQIVPPSILLMMLPLTINGIGIRENIFVFFMAPLGVSQPEALAFAWLMYGLLLLQGIIGAVAYFLRK